MSKRDSLTIQVSAFFGRKSAQQSPVAFYESVLKWPIQVGIPDICLTKPNLVLGFSVASSGSFPGT